MRRSAGPLAASEAATCHILEIRLLLSFSLREHAPKNAPVESSRANDHSSQAGIDGTPQRRTFVSSFPKSPLYFRINPGHFSAASPSFCTSSFASTVRLSGPEGNPTKSIPESYGYLCPELLRSLEQLGGRVRRFREVWSSCWEESGLRQAAGSALLRSMERCLDSF